VKPLKTTQAPEPVGPTSTASDNLLKSDKSNKAEKHEKHDKPDKREKGHEKYEPRQWAYISDNRCEAYNPRGSTQVEGVYVSV